MIGGTASSDDEEEVVQAQVQAQVSSKGKVTHTTPSPSDSDTEEDERAAPTLRGLDSDVKVTPPLAASAAAAVPPPPPPPTPPGYTPTMTDHERFLPHHQYPPLHPRARWHGGHNGGVHHGAPWQQHNQNPHWPHEGPISQTQIGAVGAGGAAAGAGGRQNENDGKALPLSLPPQQQQNDTKNRSMVRINKTLVAEIRRLKAQENVSNCELSRQHSLLMDAQRDVSQWSVANNVLRAENDDLKMKLAAFEKEKSEDMKKHVERAVQKYDNGSHRFPTLSGMKEKFTVAFTQTVSNWGQQAKDMWKTHALGKTETDVICYIRFRLLVSDIIRTIDGNISVYLEKHLKGELFQTLKDFGLKPDPKEGTDMSLSESLNPRLASLWLKIRELLRGEYDPEKWPVTQHFENLCTPLTADVIRINSKTGNALFTKTMLEDATTKSIRDEFFLQLMDLAWCCRLTPKDDLRMVYHSHVLPHKQYFEERSLACAMTSEDRLYVYVPALCTRAFNTQTANWDWTLVMQGSTTRVSLSDACYFGGYPIPDHWTDKAAMLETIQRLNGVDPTAAPVPVPATVPAGVTQEAPTIKELLSACEKEDDVVLKKMEMDAKAKGDVKNAKATSNKDAEATLNQDAEATLNKDAKATSNKDAKATLNKDSKKEKEVAAKEVKKKKKKIVKATDAPSSNPSM